MAEVEGKGGGAVGRIWRKHGGGYYALLAVGTFVFLEVQSLSESFAEASGVRDFVETELIQSIILFGLETLINTFLAGLWPFIWMSKMGVVNALAWAGGGYLVWSVVLAALLARREKEYRKELGL